MASILFIEDDPMAGLLYQRICSMLGYDFILGSSGNQGLRLADERQPDLVVLDLSLPDMDGLTVVKGLRKNDRTQSIPIIISSASTEEELRMAFKDSGVEGFIEKPLEISAFMNLAEQLIPHHDA